MPVRLEPATLGLESSTLLLSDCTHELVQHGFGRIGEDNLLPIITLRGSAEKTIMNELSRDTRFPTMLHFDKCRLGRASAASF